jgi:hypothetical protein
MMDTRMCGYLIEELSYVVVQCLTMCLRKRRGGDGGKAEARGRGAQSGREQQGGGGGGGSGLQQYQRTSMPVRRGPAEASSGQQRRPGLLDVGPMNKRPFLATSGQYMG